MNELIPYTRAADGSLQFDPMPSAPRLAGNVLRSTATVVAHAARTGVILADPEQSATRLALCQNCEQLQAGRCTLCGCYMAAKSRLAAMRCPLGVW